MFARIKEAVAVLAPDGEFGDGGGMAAP